MRSTLRLVTRFGPGQARAISSNPHLSSNLFRALALNSHPIYFNNVRTFAKKAGKDKSSNANASSGSSAADEKAVKDALLTSKTKMKDVLDRFEKKLTSIRAGGVDATLLESVTVDVAPGKKAMLSTLGMISAPSPLKLLVTLNEREHASAVEKAISGAGLNLQAKKSEDTGVVEVPVPKTTKEQREGRVKLASEETEKIKVSIRGLRQDTLKQLKKMSLPEDEQKKTEKQLQTMADAAIDKAVEMLEKKKKELLGGGSKE